MERASSELLEMFLALMPDAAVVVDGDGRIVSINPQGEHLFGYSDRELAGQPIEMLVPERFRHGHRGRRAEYGRSPKARAMGAGLELAGRRRDGSEFPVDISLAPVGGSDGSLVVAAIRDTTERATAMAAQAQLAAIVRSSTDAIIAVTVDGRVSSWNPGATGVLGYEEAEMLGRHISVVVPADTSADLEALLAAALEGHPASAADTQWRTKSGDRLNVAISVSRLSGPDGGVSGFSVLARDITARKRIEAELRRLLDEGRRQERWQAAQAEIRLAMLSGTPVEAILDLVCTRVCELAGLRGAVLLKLEDARARVVAAGGEAAILGGLVLDPLPEGIGEAAAGTGEPALPGRGLGPALSEVLGPGPVVAVAVRSAEAPAVLLAAPRGDGPMSTLEQEVVESLAGQAGLALELEHARQARELLLLSGDRERIARDLHDLVIQRLFATGMGLEGVTRLLDNPRAVQRVSAAVEDLDATIREIRSVIFSLETPVTAETGVRVELLRLAQAASESLGFEPAVRFDGPVDSAVTDDLRPHVLAVTREALSNAARHARASRLDLELSVGDDIRLVIADDGIGLGDSDRESGLANLRVRAERLGGSFELSSSPHGGTRLVWRVPLR